MNSQNISHLIRTTFLCIAVYCLSGCIIHVGGSSATANVELEDMLSLNADGIDRIIIDAGAGALKVRGDDSIDEITVDATILTTEQRHYRLSLKRNGKDAKLVAIPNTKNWGSWRKSPRIDLNVVLPSRLAVDIEDSSGDLSVKNIDNRLRVDDSSGNIIIDTVGGATLIDDGSGSIKINNVEGDIIIDDGSGNIDITATVGDIFIDDGSGSVDVLDTAGVVTIDDGSGDIYVSNATGLTIIDDGSGKMKIKNVSGQVIQNDYKDEKL